MGKTGGEDNGKCQEMCLFGGRKGRLQRRQRQSTGETEPKRAFLGDRTTNSVKNQRRAGMSKS